MPQINDLSNNRLLELLEQYGSEQGHIRSRNEEILQGLTQIFFQEENLNPDVLRGLSKLTRLDRLVLDGCTIDSLSFAASLTSLWSLSLSNTSVSDLRPLQSLSNLLSLYLDGTAVTDLRPLQSLSNLRSLSLSNTSVRDLRPLQSLSNLQSLSLNYTAVTDLRLLQSLSNLQSLSLTGTAVTDLTPLSALHALKHIVLNGLILPEIPKALVELELPFFLESGIRYDAYAHGDSGIWLENVTLTEQPISLFQQPDRKLILDWYDHHTQQAESAPLREGKVIFLGDGGVGKSYTIRRIQNGGKKPTHDTPVTPGVDIQDHEVKARDYGPEILNHKLPDQDFTIHFWDFGGQAVMRSMHRCFLTDKTCYVIVVNNRDSNERARVRTWLDNVSSFASESSVILALNQWGGNDRMDVDSLQTLQKDYPFLRSIIRYTANEDDGIEKPTFPALMNAIEILVQEMSRNHASIPAGWANVYEQIQHMKQDLIDQAAYESICRDCGVSAETGKSLLEWFNVLGICFSYHLNPQDRNAFANYKVLNPRWITNAIYIIINCIQTENGIVNHDTLRNMLSNPERSVIPNSKYKPDQLDYILDVMRNFRLSYKISKHEEFIPAISRIEEPEEVAPEQWEHHTRYLIQYKYLPETLIHRLMIDCYGDGLNMEKLWARGLRIDIRPIGLSAVLRLQNDERSLMIDLYSITGEHAPWELLKVLREKLMQLNSALGIKANEFFVAQRDNGIEDHIPVKALLDARQRNMKTYPFATNEGLYDYDVNEVLGTYFDPMLKDRFDTEDIRKVYPDIYVNELHGDFIAGGVGTMSKKHLQQDFGENNHFEGMSNVPGAKAGGDINVGNTTTHEPGEKGFLGKLGDIALGWLGKKAGTSE